MADNQAYTPVNRDLRPAYYDDFHCLAADCRLSCCKYWRISFDKKDYLSLKRQTGTPELNGRLENGLRRIRRGPLSDIHYGEFAMSGGVCPLLREDGLCALQAEKDQGALPEVCRTFPRSEVYLPSGYLEKSLSPACEGVLALLWDRQEGVDFVSDELPREKRRRSRARTDWAPAGAFHDIRSVCIDLLQDRRRPLRERILLMGLALKELADGQEGMSSWLARAQALASHVEAGELLRQAAEGGLALPKFISSNLRVLLTVQSTDADFQAVRRELAEALDVSFKSGTSDATVDQIPYLNARARLAQQLGEQGERFMENLMVSLFFHLHLPDVGSAEALWKSYVNFCNLYSYYRFLAVMSCREGVEDCRAELFRLTVHASRALIHNGTRQADLRDEFFENDSATLAHMTILISE